MIELHIPLQAPSQNLFSVYTNWRIRSRTTKRIRGQWAAACRIAMANQRLAAAVGPRRLHIIAYRRQRCRDEANLIGGLKPAIDGLVDAGLLIDDSARFATITYAQGTLSQSPTKRALTVLRIESLDSQRSQLETTNQEASL